VARRRWTRASGSRRGRAYLFFSFSVSHPANIDQSEGLAMVCVPAVSVRRERAGETVARQQDAHPMVSLEPRGAVPVLVEVRTVCVRRAKRRYMTRCWPMSSRPANVPSGRSPGEIRSSE
jgi:hypothetical protein